MPFDSPAAAPAGLRLRDPELEAEVARSWRRRQDYEARGYVFPGYPPPPLPWWLLAPAERRQRHAELLARGVVPAWHEPGEPPAAPADLPKAPARNRRAGRAPARRPATRPDAAGPAPQAGGRPAGRRPPPRRPRPPRQTWVQMYFISR